MQGEISYDLVMEDDMRLPRERTLGGGRMAGIHRLA